MVSIFRSIKNLYGKDGRRSKLLVTGVLLVIIAFLFIPNHLALAGNDIGQLVEPSWWMQLLAGILLQIASLFLKISLFFLTFIIELASYNGYLDAPAVTIGWVMVRDITNMFFVVMLLLIAFGTILGIEQYEWKKLIVKFVLAAVLVNFSRLICGVFIDLSQVVMSTFVNGIVATAGGNVIAMFNLDKITSIARDANPEHLDAGLFTATIASVVFAGMVMMTLGVFITMLAARVIRLWILIVLSPLAFVLDVIPLTQKFAGQWWTEIGDDLVTGPVLLFFIWLSFVSLGSGDINTHLAANADIPESSKIREGTVLASGADSIGVQEGQSAGIGAAMTWTRMANFAIAVGMLFAGARVASTIGGSSGSALTKVGEFGKKVATIATGYAAGRWLYESGKSGAKTVGKAAGWGLYHGSGAASAVNRTKNWGIRQWEGFQAWRHATGGKTMQEEEYIDEKTGEKKYQAKRYTKADEAAGLGKAGDIVYKDVKLGAIQKFFQKRILKDIASEKKLEKTKKFAETRKESLTKDIKGVPTSFFMKPYEQIDALDRFEKGKLEEKEARSAAKTKEFGGLGKLVESQTARKQFVGTKLMPPKKDEEGKEATTAEEVAAHSVRADRISKLQENVELKLRTKILSAKGGVEAKKLGEAQAAAETSHELAQGVEESARSKALQHELEESEHELQQIEESPEMMELFAKLKEAAAGADDKTASEESRKKADETAKGLMKDINKLRVTMINNMAKEGKLLAWQAMRAQAEREHQALFFRGFRQKMIDDAGQRHIWDAQGIPTPNNAQREIIESLTKNFHDMNYEQGVAAFESHMANIADKRAAGTPLDFQDRAVSMVLHKILFNGSWIDDGIIPVDEQEKRQEHARKLALSYDFSGNQVTGNEAAEELKGQIQKLSRPLQSVPLTQNQASSFARVFKAGLGDSAKTQLEDFLRTGSEETRQNLLRTMKANLAEMAKLGDTVLLDVFKKMSISQGDVAGVLKHIVHPDSRQAILGMLS